MSRHAMEMALSALVEALNICEPDLCGENREFRGSRLWATKTSCADDDLDAEGRVRMAIDALQKALGLQGNTEAAAA